MSKPLIDLNRTNRPTSPLAAANTEAAEPAQSQPAKGPEITVKAAPVRTKVQPTSPPANDRGSTLGARIPESLHHKIKVFCTANRMEMQQFVQDALVNHLALLEDATNRDQAA